MKKVRILVTTKAGTVFEKDMDMPFVPNPGTVLWLTIGGTDHKLVVKGLGWEEKRNLTFARVDGSKMTESRYPLKDNPNFYFENDPAWKRNY